MHSRLSWLAFKRLLQYSDAPIFVGPWRGEVGFEVLYWIPFLHRLMKKHGIDPSRIIPITRGGAGEWYGTDRFVELYKLTTPQDVRVENRIQHAKNLMLKQIEWTSWDRAIVKKAAALLCMPRYLTIHPSWMFQRLEAFFGGGMSLVDLEQECLFDPLVAPAATGLPERFVAVRFYLRATFPHAPHVVQFAQECVKAISAHTPVVLLHSGVHADDHVDIGYAPHPNVHLLSDFGQVTPETNLALQSAVIARAQGFVGTYGGTAQLALRLGKPSVSFYNEWKGTALAHKHLADAIAVQRNIPCQVHQIQGLAILQSVVPQVHLDAAVKLHEHPV